MAKEKAADSEVTEDQSALTAYVLKKSHGVVMNGRTSHHYPAGTSFDIEKDAAIIALLARTGAQFE